MRMAKIKSTTALVRAVKHDNRDRMPSNADDQRSAQNFYFGGSISETMNRFKTLRPKKVRENAVHAVELFMSASNDFNGNWNDYLKAADKWAMGLFGSENLLYCAHHHDETTPHTHVLFIPLKDGKLNAKHFIGGSRDRLVELQDDFYEKVGKPFELKRGQSKSETKARHSHHNLSGKAAELDKREENLNVKCLEYLEAEDKLKQREEEINKLREKVLREYKQQFDDFKAELTSREKVLSESEQQLEILKDEYVKLMGIKPDDVRKIKTLTDKWDKTTPDGLRVIAKDIEQSGAANVGEYRMAREAEHEKQQSRSSSFRK